MWISKKDFEQINTNFLNLEERVVELEEAIERRKRAGRLYTKRLSKLENKGK